MDSGIKTIGVCRSNPQTDTACVVGKELVSD
jgi:hypothetical protein